MQTLAVILEEVIPGDVAGVGEASLGDLGSDGVDDGRLVLEGEEVRDETGHDEFRQVDEEIVVDKILLFQNDQQLPSLWIW